MAACVARASELTSKKYVYADKLEGMVDGSTNMSMTSENADTLISTILHLNGYTRITMGKDTYKVINARDVRYMATTQVEASSDKAPELASVDDYYTMDYTILNPETGEHITRNLRPYLSRYGRIIFQENSSSLIIQDTANNILRMYKMISKMDKKPSAQVLAQWEADKKHFREIELVEAQACSNNGPAHHKKDAKPKSSKKRP